MDDADEDFHEGRTVVAYLADTLLAPLRVALSPILLRTYLQTIVLLFTSTVLFIAAIIAYSTFYLSYIPVRGISVPVYLQYDHSQNPISSIPQIPPHNKFPFGIANVRGLASRQKYDVVVEIALPRSENNVGVGNWMVGVEMRGPQMVTAGAGVKGMLGWQEEWDVSDFSHGGEAGSERESSSRPGADNDGTGAAGLGRLNGEKPVILARSRRPAILTYRSRITDLAYRALRLPLYILNFHQESELIKITMMEGVEFKKGWRNIPTSLKLELRSKTPLEVYRVMVRFVARLEGLRWVMYHYWVTSFVVFTGLFWGIEMTVVLLTWCVFSVFLSGGARQAQEEGGGEKKRIKLEEGSGAVTPGTEAAESEPSTPMSDTSRTFPTLPSHRPLQYASSSGEARFKEERRMPRLEDIPARTEAEADDEDEDADFILEEPVPISAGGVLTDSGIGTSLESSRDGDGGRGIARRRSGKRER